MRRAITIAITMAATLSMGGTAFADTPNNGDGGAPNNIVKIVNTGGTDFRSSTQIVFVSGNTQANNVANALSRDCTGCHTRAVAVQEVIVLGSPTQFTPYNYAVAGNLRCTSCDTTAYAYQNVIQSSPGAHLSGDTRERIRQLQQQINAVTHDPNISDKPYIANGVVHSDLNDRLDSLVQQLNKTIQNGLIADGSGAQHESSDRGAEAA